MPRIEDILRQAREVGAGDVHLTAGISPRMRVNGELIAMDCPKIQASDTLDILLEIMPQIQRERFEEKGEYVFSFSIPNGGRYRVSAYMQRGNVAMTFRVIRLNVPTPDELGCPEVIEALCRKESGLVLVTGPTGSGKTTTVAAMVDRINNNRDVHVITLENPIEYLHSHNRAMISQREIGMDSMNYADALHAALREDADVIMVGEMQDAETINAAIHAAEMGHLVLATMCTDGTVNTIRHIIAEFQQHQQSQVRSRLSNVLGAVISQRLLPVGNDGNRVAAFEVLHGNDAVRDLIREGKLCELTDLVCSEAK